MKNERDTLHDWHTEEVIIAFLFINNENYDIISQNLSAHCFYYQLFQETYKAIEILISMGKTADPQTVATYIKNTQKFDYERPIEDVLVEIANKYIHSFQLYNVEQKSVFLQSLYQKRETIKIIQGFIPDIQNSSNDTQENIQALEEKLYRIIENQSTDQITTLADVFANIVKKIDHIKTHGTKLSIDTGYHDINNKISGWSNGDLIILAGRPSMGKTALAIGMAMNAGRYLQNEKKSVAVFSLEMSSEQLVNRMIAVQTGVPSNKIASGMVNDAEFQAIMTEMPKFTQMPIIIDDTPALSIPELRAKVRRMKRKHNIAFAVVDYLQLMRSSSKSKENRVQEISDITQNLKSIAREFNIPIVALSQLSRNVESREDKRPQLQDLRDSGSIEQDADIVMFLYRESYYLERSMPSKENIESYNEWMAQNGEKYMQIEHTAEVIIAKHRNGPIGTALLRFDKETTRFENLSTVKY